MQSVLFKVGTLSVGLVVGLTMLLTQQPADAGVGTSAIKIRSDAQTFSLNDGQSQFDGGVEVAMAGTEVKGGSADIQVDSAGKPSKAVFSKRSTLVRKEGEGMTQTIQADNMQMDLQSNGLEARGGVTTHLSGDKDLGDVSIQSDNQIFDQERHVMKASGNVVVKKEDMTASSPEAIIFMNGSGKADKIVFIKGANLKQGTQEMRGQTITIQVASGDIFAENNTESVVDGKDSAGNPTRVNIKSHLQELDKETGRLIANGNAVIHYEDYVASGPKAVFYRDQEVLDHIVLTGRAQIEDPERKVTGDVVTININPKQFNAKGNVTTFIKAKGKSQTASATSGTKGGAVKSAAPAPANTEQRAQQALDEESMIKQAEGQ